MAFNRVTAGLAASTLRVQVKPDGEGSSVVAIRYTVVPTSAAGEAYAEERYERFDLLDSVLWWERSMNHFLETGRMLCRDARDVVSRTRATDPDDKDKE